MLQTDRSLMCGVAFNHHDSSVAFAQDGEVRLVLEAERVFRRKKMRCTAEEMEQLIIFGLTLLGAQPEDVSHWALATLENPWLSEQDRRPVAPRWSHQRILGQQRDCMIVNHHLSHAAAFLFSPFEEALTVTCDGGGDFGERMAVYLGYGIELEKAAVTTEGFISAKPYDLCSTYLYGRPRCEGRMMALAAYGEPQDAIIGWLSEMAATLSTTTYATGHDVLKRRFPDIEGQASERHEGACDFAASVQRWFTACRVRDVESLIRSMQPKALVLAGGACLNLEANTALWERHPDIPIFIPPCCDDTGQALGALALMMASVTGRRPTVPLPYLGQGERTSALPEAAVEAAVDALLRNKIILLHQGPGEIGPRALGNRSFLARPDSSDVMRTLSCTVKRREPYRPVAPVTLESETSTWFQGPDCSPYMLFQHQAPDTVHEALAGCVHRDGTARVQTVTEASNPFLAEVLKRFGDRTGIPILLNTSLNLNGHPIAATPQDTADIAEQVRVPHLTVVNATVFDA